jgi:putative cardiolipin synthase
MNQRSETAFRNLMRCLLVMLISSAAFGQTSSADTLRVLDDNTDALQARFELIDSAKWRIDIACFELRADDVSHAVLAHLWMAARRGVEVRLVVDAYGNHISSSVLAELIGDGVQIRRFHPFRLQEAHRYTRRMHDKLLISDRGAMILGGRNFGAVYYGRSRDANFIDCDFRITGSTVDSASDYFEQLWVSAAVEPFCDGCGTSNRWQKRRQTTYDSPAGIPLTTPAGLLRRGLCKVNADVSRKRVFVRPGPVFQVPPERLRFLHSNRVVTSETPDITDEILALIDSSCREIMIETPYLILSRRFERALRAAAQRGVCVRLLGNSLASIDKPLAHAGYVNQKVMMLRMGIDLWEYQGPDMLHAKTILVDDCSVIGSYDLHPRSEYYDTETAVLVSDPRITAAIRASMMQHFAGAVRVSRSPGYRHMRGLKGSPPRTRIIQMQIFRLPALLLKKHL